MRPITSVRLSGHQHRLLQSPLRTAQIAARLGTFSEEHYHTLAAALQLAHRLAGVVPRHRAIREELQPCIDALNAVYDRGQGGRWEMSEDEAAEIDAGVSIYESLLLTSSSKHIRQALEKTRKDFQEEA